MDNGLYGKSMENKRHRILLENVTEIRRLMRLISQPDFKDRTIYNEFYNESVVAVHRRQSEIYMYKPIYVGHAILDISKTIMYDFYYGHLKPTYGDRMELLYMDTGKKFKMKIILNTLISILYLQTPSFWSLTLAISWLRCCQPWTSTTPPTILQGTLSSLQRTRR
jgi:hypothetical protein